MEKKKRKFGAHLACVWSMKTRNKVALEYEQLRLLFALGVHASHTLIPTYGGGKEQESLHEAELVGCLCFKNSPRLMTHCQFFVNQELEFCGTLHLPSGLHQEANPQSF